MPDSKGELKRYNPIGYAQMEQFPDGDYVGYAEHRAALSTAEQRIEELEKEYGEYKLSHPRWRVIPINNPPEWHNCDQMGCASIGPHYEYAEGNPWAEYGWKLEKAQSSLSKAEATIAELRKEIEDYERGLWSAEATIKDLRAEREKEFQRFADYWEETWGTVPSYKRTVNNVVAAFLAQKEGK